MFDTKSDYIIFQAILFASYTQIPRIPVGIVLVQTTFRSVSYTPLQVAALRHHHHHIISLSGRCNLLIVSEYNITSANRPYSCYYTAYEPKY